MIYEARTIFHPKTFNAMNYDDETQTNRDQPILLSLFVIFGQTVAARNLINRWATERKTDRLNFTMTKFSRAYANITKIEHKIVVLWRMFWEEKKLIKLCIGQWDAATASTSASWVNASGEICDAFEPSIRLNIVECCHGKYFSMSNLWYFPFIVQWNSQAHKRARARWSNEEKRERENWQAAHHHQSANERMLQNQHANAKAFIYIWRWYNEIAAGRACLQKVSIKQITVFFGWDLTIFAIKWQMMRSRLKLWV